MNCTARSSEICSAGVSSRVDVVRHNDEFVKKKFSLIAIVRQCVYQEPCGRVATEDPQTLDGDGGDEEDAVRVHLAMVAGTVTVCP
jgi:hypothetical protein